MPGASKRRGRSDKQNQRGAAQEPPQPAAPQGASTRGGPGPPQPPAAPSAAQPGSSSQNPANAPTSDPQSVRSPSHEQRDTQLVERYPAPFLNKNVDFGGNAYNLLSDEKMPTSLMPRPAKFNSSGKEVVINVNSHRITAYPTKKIWQYDVSIGNGAEKRGLIKSIWESRSLKNRLGNGFIFDGNKLGWSMNDFGQEMKIVIDLDAERNIQPREGRTPNVHTIIIRKAKPLNLSVIDGYLSGSMSFDNSVLEAISFLDHLLRETPSHKHIAVKRSYFGRTTEERMILGSGIEAMKGVYQSIRAAQGRSLVVNVDVSNTCFWHQTTLAMLAFQVSGCDTFDQLANKSLPEETRTGTRESAVFMMLKRLHKTEIRVDFRGCPKSVQEKRFKILRVSECSARTFKFDFKHRDTGKEENISIFEYFKRKYNIHLQYPDIPVLEMTKRGVTYPMEVCHMLGGQRYPYKLNELATATMIKFAVSKPALRKDSINRGLTMLDWPNDPFLRNYGLKIDPEMLKTKARVLNPPDVQFAKGGVAKPGFSGRWDLRQKVFLKNNEQGLKAWGVAMIRGPGITHRASLDDVKAFISAFIRAYRGHGGEVIDTQPIILEDQPDGATACSTLFTTVGNKNQARPQMFIFILPTKSVDVYNRIKKSADCRYGIVSQCLLGIQVKKNSPQYHSNVCMKFNAKLGGTTCRVASRDPKGHFKVPTMIIGADVSHAAPGMPGAASFAALTMSLDAIAARYAAAVETNGSRVEMIAPKNIEDMLGPLIRNWCENVGQGKLPEHVYYFRDGVSEGQYNAVLRHEVADLKRLFYDIGKYNPNLSVKFTVVVAEKRHHIRFFPQPGPGSDKNGNPVPGTLVERDVTHPFEYDFYLCSHAAIQGTARPTHYHMLMDECGVAGDQFQTMLYEHSYQYMRATTPVSLFPAVYYAHLASNRARSHLDIGFSEMERQKKSGTSSSDKPDTEIKKLLPMANQTRIWFSMWYI